MFRASPWIPYDPSHRQSLPTDSIPNDGPSVDVPLPPPTQPPMDAPEISILREEEETPPPEAGGLSFSKFRVNVRQSTWSQGAAKSGRATPPGVPPAPGARRTAPSLQDSDDEDEEDQLIDDDELGVVTEAGRGQAAAVAPASSPSLAARGSPAPSSSARKRGGGVTKARQRRGAATGRRGRPGREPPDAAAMMGTFEVAKAEQPATSTQQIVPPPTPVMVDPPPPVAGPSTTDWTAAPPPKPVRKKPGPKKGTTLGPRGPRKSASKTAQNAPGTSTPLLDDPLPTEPSTFHLLVPSPSIPPTPGPDQTPLPSSHLPPILPPDFTDGSSIPIPVYPLPSRAFPVQPPPKVPSGYAPTHPIDPNRGPARKWTVMYREIKGIGGGRWFARTWVAPRSLPDTSARPVSPSAQTDAAAPPPPPPPFVSSETRPSRVSAPGSRASSVKAEVGPGLPLSDSDQVDPAPWPTVAQDHETAVSSRGPGSPQTRTSASPSPAPDAVAETQPGPL